MSKRSETWHSERLGREVSVRRWGEVGTPVVFFPTAAGDCEECERFLLVDALSELLTEGRIKLYSVDSIPGMVWLKESNDARSGASMQLRFDSFLREEFVPFVRDDCGVERDDDSLELIASGSSIGAYEALIATCRHPEVFKTAICMSGTYDLSKFLEGPRGEEWNSVSPLELLPRLDEDDPRLGRLRERFVLLAHATGRWEEPGQSWRVAEALGNRGVPNRVDEWGAEWDHDWPVWREMLPQYLAELLPESEED